jgi:P27 family predicted phage terminase small subunit
MRGRTPKPSALRALTGNLTAGTEPTPTKGAPDEPEHVQTDPVAHAEWVALCGILDDMGLLATSDRAIMELYCTTYSEWRAALDMVRKYGMTVFADKAKTILRESPFATIRNAARKACIEMLREMGLSAVSRTRLRVPTKARKTDDRWQGLLN